MKFVLVDGVLEPGFLPVDLLCPFALVFRAEDPSTEVFGFDDEDSGGGNNDMVELGGSGSIRVRDVEIAEMPVACVIKFSEAAVYNPLTEPSIEFW